MLISRVIFVALPLLLAPIAYGSIFSSTSEYEACAARKAYKNDDCYKPIGQGITMCCWEEINVDTGKRVKYCQICGVDGDPENCAPKFRDLSSSAGEVAEPGQTPPTQTFPGGDVFSPPTGGVVGPDEDKKPTGTFPGDDVFSPPTGGVADPDPGTDDNPTKPKTLGGSKDNIGTAKPPRELEQGSFDPPEPPDDDSGKENDDQRGQDLKAKGPDESDLPSGGDGGSGVVG